MRSQHWTRAWIVRFGLLALLSPALSPPFSVLPDEWIEQARIFEIPLRKVEGRAPSGAENLALASALERFQQAGAGHGTDHRGPRRVGAQP